MEQYGGQNPAVRKLLGTRHKGEKKLEDTESLQPSRGKVLLKDMHHLATIESLPTYVWVMFFVVLAFLVTITIILMVLAFK